MNNSESINVRITITAEQWDILYKSTREHGFSHAIHSKLHKILACDPCNSLETSIPIKKVTKDVTISKQYSQQLLCASFREGIQPATFIYRYILFPIFSEHSLSE